MNTPMRRCGLIASLTVAGFATTTTAQAQSQSLALAQPAATLDPTAAQLRLALQHRAAGDHAGALAIAEQAGATRMTSRIRRFIAEEQRALGYYAAALASAETCARETGTLAPGQGRDETAAACRVVAEAVRREVGFVNLRVRELGRMGLRVAVAGREVPADWWGQAYPVMPGVVDVAATAPGRPTFLQRVTVEAGQTATVDVVLVSRSPGHATGVTQGVALRDEVDDSHSLPWVLVGVGGAALVTAGAFFAAYGIAADSCSSALLCTPTAQRQHDQADTLLNVGIGLGIGGVVALAGGLIWRYAVGDHEATPTSIRAAMTFAPVEGGWVVGLRGGM